MIMDITAISDLHGFYPELPGGDLLIVAGDLTASDSNLQYEDFYKWLDSQNYTKKIVIAGNHDNYFYGCYSFPDPKVIPFGLKNTEYLCDSGTKFMGYRIWGSPWSKSFPGMNPKCKAFVVDTEEELDDKFSKIPDDIDILITHSPPRGIFDLNAKPKACGSSSLLKHINRVMPKLHVFGHIHEGYCSKEIDMHLRLSPKEKLNNFKARFVNASHVNEYYEPVNKPIRIEL